MRSSFPRGTVYYAIQVDSYFCVCGQNEVVWKKATEQYFTVSLFIRLYEVVLTFKSVSENLWCDHLNESY